MAATKRELAGLLDRLFTLKTITQTYQQVAANHIRRARTSVVRNRDFVSELLQVFQEIKRAYQEEMSVLEKKKKIKDMNKLSFIKRNGKTIVVFLAANTGLYGSIVGKTAAMLHEYLKQNEAEVLIIGKLGESLFVQQNPGKQYTYFDFPDNKIDSDNLKKIIQHIVQYQNILVFYGQFQSIVSQDPIIASLDGSGSTDQSQSQAPAVKYLFEPSLEKIAIFFETEIFGIVFEQTIRESQLAKHASRMYALDLAIQNISQNLDKVKFQKNQLHHKTINSKQLNSLSGFSLWGRM